MWLKTIDRLAILYFFHVSPEMILKGQISYEKFPKKEFEELLRCYAAEYSDTENHLIYRNMDLQASYSKGDRDIESNLNVYYDLIHVVEEILEIRNNEIVCKYNELRRWREVTRYLGEELPVCIFLARQYQKYGRAYNWYSWNTVLSNTNQQLRAILKQGISDNHFHLFGSAPVFQLIWLKLMNNVNMNSYIKGLAGIKKGRRNMHFYFDEKYDEISMEGMILQAAFMRAVMFAYINGKEYIFNSNENDEIGYAFEDDLIHYLDKRDRICDIQPEIRRIVNVLKAQAVDERSENCADYALETVAYHTQLNWMFSGERKLIYEMLCDVLVRKELPENVRNMLYPYLVIRAKLRGEIIQNNENLGFENFAIYSKQKNGILTSMHDKNAMVEHAILSSFEPGNLKSLEIRISPANTCIQDAMLIDWYDRVIAKCGKIEKRQYFYVFHFSKKMDRNIEKWTDDNIVVKCRDYDVRKKIQVQGYAIEELRNRMPVEAERVHGIDACAQEIGCRPEVFGPVFRKLRHHIVDLDNGLDNRQLKVTYHVGEDFLDITDGLRAVDEAIKFLGLENGDRLGHATVLGISVRKWYEKKGKRIEILRQDYLDNVVWMYHKILEYELTGFDILKDFLEGEFKANYQLVYEKNMQEKDIIKADIYCYYDSWKLRGDHPELYNAEGYYPDMLYRNDSYKMNLDYPENPGLRDKKDVAGLYYMYHYNKKVRIAGNEPIECTIRDMYIQALEQIQKRLREQISRIGLGIETNPSSNLLISTMTDYDEHPIFNMYHPGSMMDKQDSDTQLYVSINTDDKGVFHTSLENEYSLMASALENMKDENGKYIFSPQEVYEWVDKVRIMGNQQIF